MTDPEVKMKGKKDKRKSAEEYQHDTLKQLREENSRLKTELEQINKELHVFKAKFDANSSPLLGEELNVIEAEKSIDFISSKYDDLMEFKRSANMILESLQLQN